MESEKVKEIKDWLENESEVYRNEIAYNTLDLINELESENERLSNTEIGELIKENEELAKQCEDWCEITLKKRNQIVELKDRIAELEKIGLNEEMTVGEYLREMERLKKDNELLRNAKVVYENVDYCYEDLKKAEKRIADLEKENKENNSYAKGYADGIKNTYKVVVPDKLKQFAERLKKELKGIVGANFIDRILKEFINKGERL